jgi:alkylation response protein AidB-like acyl-CoA dehydrogenase
MTVVAAAELDLFASTTRAFLDKEASLAGVRALHDAGSSFERPWWRQAAELGWTALLVPEELDGGSASGDGVRDLAVVSSLIGRTVAPGPLHPVSTVLAALVDADNRDTHAPLIADLLCGQVVAAWAVYEPDKPWAPTEPLLEATPTATGFRLDGEKDRVEAGTDCDVVLAVARCQGAVRQFVVPMDAAGCSRVREPSIDLVKGYAQIRFDGVELGHDAVVGSQEQTCDLIEWQSQIALVLQCSELVGILEAVLTMTIQWAQDRHSFGRPLGSYQALKHRFADMKTWFEACRAATAGAVAAVGARRADAAVSASIAKSFVADRATAIIQDCIQLHGGIGVTWEHDLHLYLRRATLYRAMFGTPEHHNLAVYAHRQTTPSRN